MNTYRRQTGMTLISWIILIILVGFLGLFGFRLFPLYMEYYSIDKALATVAKGIQPGESPEQIRISLSNLFDVNYVNDIKPVDVKIGHSPDNNAVTLTLDYDPETNFIANIDMIVHFHIVKQANPI